MNRYPTEAQPGQQLVAVTIDFERDPINHILSSQSGDVYLTDQKGQTIYYTVDTGQLAAEPPGASPSRTATFVFSVPAGQTNFVFHYGPKYVRELS